MLRKLSNEEAKSLEDCLAVNGLTFDSQENAEKYFFAEKDKDLEEIKALGDKFPQLNLDFKAGSLKRLEAFYFSCYVDRTQSIDIPKERFEMLITQYMRQVFISNQMAEWMVFENDFSPGRYELGIMYGYGAGGMEHYAHDLDKKPENKERKYLYDNFMLYVPKERENEIQ